MARRGVTATGLTKRFPAARRVAFLRAAVPTRRDGASGLVAVDDATFHLEPGEILGVVGPNGAGKSTILKLVGSILAATSGAVVVDGTSVALIELGLAFHPELTGWENLPVAAALLGMTGDELVDRLDDIVDFSGIRESLDLPMKHFSSGMTARLGFALAVHVPASVLLVDEVLAIGDRSFQQRCVRKVRELAAGGTGVLVVSHSLDLVAQVCDRAVCIEGGRIVDEGPVSDVLNRYRRHSPASIDAGDDRPGAITRLELASESIRSGERLEVSCVVGVSDPAAGLTVRSEIVERGHGGTRNVDAVPPGAMGSVGAWTLTASIGPVVLSAAKMELVVTLVAGENATVVDRRTVPFEVEGADVGAAILVAPGIWTATPAPAEPFPSAPVRRSGDRDSLVRCVGLTKSFPAARGLAGVRGPRTTALDDLSFTIGRGEAVALVGNNGAGKSTLLRVLTGVTAADRGRIAVDGSVAAVLELGAAHHGELTGRENLRFAWHLHGGATDDFPEAAAFVEDFSGLGDFLDEPMKHYSTGMAARLDISLALALRRDVLVVDEALSVGDAEFRTRTAARVAELVAGGTSLVFASHDLQLVSTLCDRVLRLDHGRLVADGSTDLIVEGLGGVGWSAGPDAPDERISLRNLRVSPDRLDWYEPFDVEFVVEISEPIVGCTIELGVRDHLSAEERLDHRRPDDVMRATLCVAPVDLPEGWSRVPGRHLVRGRLDGLPLLGRLDVVITVSDSIDGRVLAERFRTVWFGTAGENVVAAAFDARWSAAIES